MSFTVNILYSGQNGNARRFAEDMVNEGIVEKIRKQPGNERYEYYFPMDDEESILLIDRWSNQEALDTHHKSDMMKQIANLREKYHLRMSVEKFIDF
ncbi:MULTISPECIES: antibiotic biosynthesis monooxygenase family protein [Vagococcus]|uniref:antibiotic biosynthesis monooxygenase family protein n=1 Tax=Vagococcus TaxID=2737 RepID=UPI000E4A61E1|nr:MULTISPECIES: antibiotic biosynthesis monooxygenase [Vagococcus]RHH68069.1 antibiotic biosynthesis monooxygenase [Vagococcus sp. AM17-17]